MALPMSMELNLCRLNDNQLPDDRGRFENMANAEQAVSAFLLSEQVKTIRMKDFLFWRLQDGTL